MKYTKELENKLISKINELYISNRKRFTILTKEGRYLASTAMKGNPKLSDPWIRNHIRENQTVVVFSGEKISKFLCFDVDVVDKIKAKWVTFKVINRLRLLGFKDEHIHTSTSGNKGYHILLFVEGGASLLSLKEIFNIVLREEELEKFKYGQVEFRPAYKQGVKIELSRNFKNTKSDNYCWFVQNDNLHKIKNKEHILTINPIEKELFNDIYESIIDTYREEKEAATIEKKLIETLNEPASHKIHKEENATIDHAVDLLNNGLRIEGSRHNSTLTIATYLRYLGNDREDCMKILKEWMTKQSNRYYKNTLEYTLNECVRITNIVYDNEYTIKTDYEEIRIYKSEMDKVLQIKNKNMKLVLYAMLIHSKRYALNNGVFYMTYNQMSEMTGLSLRSMQNIISKLEYESIIAVCERNIKNGHSYLKKPNKYTVNIASSNANSEEFFSLNYTSNNNTTNLYFDNIVKLFTIEELKSLPKRQYYEIKNIYSMSS